MRDPSRTLVGCDEHDVSMDDANEDDASEAGTGQDERSVRVSIIGPGKVGTALAILLHRAGFSIGDIVGRSADAARRAVRIIGAGAPAERLTAAAGFVIIATQDDFIEDVVRSLDQDDSATVPPSCAGPWFYM